MTQSAPRGAPDPGDIGRRLTFRREQLGLTREEAASQAGMATEYLAYLEKHPSSPSGPGLARLAGVLETTVGWLRGGGTDLPPGQGQAARHPELRELAPEECWDRLSTHGVGRIAVSAPEGPAIIPVNYLVLEEKEGEERIAFRTAPGSLPSAAVGHEVAFEVDHVDEALKKGWSVLVVGRARIATEAEAARLTEQVPTEPWAGGKREQWVLIRAERVTGRRIHTD